MSSLQGTSPFVEEIYAMYPEPRSFMGVVGRIRRAASNPSSGAGCCLARRNDLALEEEATVESI